MATDGRKASWKGDVSELVAAIEPSAQRGKCFLPAAKTASDTGNVICANRGMWCKLRELAPSLSFAKPDVKDAFIEVL